MPDEAPPAERPATFGEVFSSSEFRAVFVASSLSWFGDYLARAAVTALVFQQTESVTLSAAAFAVSYLPWVLGGPLLAAVAERYRYRDVLVICDLTRMALITLVALASGNTPLMIALLFVTSMITPPAQAARSALLPAILTGDRLVVGLSLHTTAGQAAQIAGYAGGAALAPFNPRLALLIDAATFAASAVLVRFGIRDRPPVSVRRSHLLRETAEGFQMVFGTPVLRAIAVLVFASTLFAVVPEGLAAAWSHQLGDTQTERGVAQGMIMTGCQIGFVTGGLLIGRLVRPDMRRRLIRPFAVLIPLALVPALVSPPAFGVALIAALGGFAIAGMMPAANGLFVQALPDGYRARSFGVMQSGMQIMQGLAVLSTGALADVFPLPVVVGCWGLAGLALMLLAASRWPSPAQFAAATAAAAEHNRAVAEAAGRGGTLGDGLPAGFGQAASEGQHDTAAPASGHGFPGAGGSGTGGSHRRGPGAPGNGVLTPPGPLGQGGRYIPRHRAGSRSDARHPA